MGQPGRLDALLSEAGFSHVSVEAAELTVRFPSPERFVAMSVQGAAALPEVERAALSGGMQRDVADWIGAHTEGGMLLDTMQVFIAGATR